MTVDADLRRRLAEAEATLDALRLGEVDAIVGGKEILLVSEREAEIALRASQARYQTLLDSIDQGFCVIEVLFDEAGRAHDYCFLETNHAFEAYTGIAGAVGRRLREVTPDVEHSWFERYGRVATTGQPERFESTVTSLGRVFDVYAFRVDQPSQRRVAVLYKDITATALETQRREQSERALRRSEERWSAAIDHFGEGAIIADANEQVVYWNPAARRMHGLKDDLDGMGSLESTQLTFQLWKPDGSQMIELDEWPVRRIKRGETVDHLELRLRRPDQGWERVVSYSGAMVTTPSGEQLIFLSVFDLTEQRKAEAALRESEWRFRRLADTMPQLVWTATREGVVDYYNSQVSRYSGIHPQRDGSWSWQPILHPDDHARTVRAWERATRTGSVYECEHRVRMANGSFRWHLSRAYRVGLAGAMQWFGTATDIHDLKLAQERLIESEHRFKTMANTAPAMLWITDERNQSTFRSRGWHEHTGMPRDAGLGTTWLEAVHPDDRDRVRQNFLDSAARHEPFMIDYRLRTSDGSYRWAVDAGRPRLDEAGAFLGCIGAVFDVHERKQAEEALRDADRRKDEFLAVLAHELRNPLAPLRNGLATLRLVRADSDTARDVRAIMERQVDQMVRLIDDLLDTSRIARGKFDLRRQHIDLVETVRHAVDACRPLLAAARHELHLQLPESPLLVDADAVRVAQVITNLINNAAHYTDPGGNVTVAIRREGNQGVVVVQDDGIGIAEGMFERVFEPFVQLDATASRTRHGGLGLGLALARSIVELHGGTIRASPGASGRGSMFTVRLPEAAAGTLRAVGDARPESQGPRLRVLVVDDNRDAAESLGVLLELMGHAVQVVNDGPDALRMAQSQSPDVVLLDIGMPGMDGYEVARRLRDLPARAVMRVVALTGYGQEADRRRSTEAGFDAHLVKPMDVAALQALITTQRRESPALRG